MDRESAHSFCLSLPGAYEDFPFGEVSVYKVRGKMFALLTPPSTEPVHISLKCDPVLSVILREQFPAVQPGYHLNKQHWNTVTLDGTLEEPQILDMIEDSYQLVVKSLPKAVRQALERNASDLS